MNATSSYFPPYTHNFSLISSLICTVHIKAHRERVSGLNLKCFNKSDLPVAKIDKERTKKYLKNKFKTIKYTLNICYLIIFN